MLFMLTLKALSVLEIFTFLSILLVMYKNGLIRIQGLISTFQHDATDWKINN